MMNDIGRGRDRTQAMTCHVFAWACLLMMAGPVAAEMSAGGDVWLDEPIALGRGVEQADLDRVGQALRKALSEAVGGELLSGRAALLQRTAASPLVGNRLKTARSLVDKGEELYMSFKFSAAAATLAEAADLFTVLLDHLEADDVKLLYRARLLEGLSWFDANQEAAARTAFTRLIVMRPDFEPDPSLVSPKAREAFRQALAEVRGAGLASLEVRSRPGGAEVVLDGLPRGRTPISIAALPRGKHHLRLVLPGYQAHSQEIEIRPPASAQREVRLEITPALGALERLRKAALAGQSPELAKGDLDLLARSAQLGSIVMVGLLRRSAEPGAEPVARDLLVTAFRWSRSGRSAVASLTSVADAEADMKRVAESLVGTWPGTQWPEDDPRSVVDFSRALLGVGPDWKEKDTDEDESDGLLSKWWFWTGLAVLAGGAAAGVVLLTTSGSSSPDQTRFVLEFSNVP